MNRSSILWIVATGSASVLACSTTLAEPVACTPDERVVFSCRAGPKAIAVCEGKDEKGTFAYRFGQPAKAEITLSSAGVGDGKATVSGGSLDYSGGGGAYLRFRKEAVDYVVYTAISSQWGEQSGVVAERDGKTLRSTRCAGRVRSTIGPELFKQSGIPVDGAGFVLPR